MKKYLFLIPLLSIFIIDSGISQITIAPTNMFIEGNTRFGTYMVINNSNETQEISIDFTFSYSSSDSAGTRSIVTDDPEIEDQYSIAEYIKAFPRNFTLAKDQRQIVRLRLSPPSDLPDGTYWARIKTGSSPEAPPVELQASNTVSAKVGIRVEQITGIFYKKGNVTTGIEISDMNTNYDSEKGTLTLLTDIKRTGNSPFLGSITATMKNPSGEEVRRAFSSTSIYFDGIYKNIFDIKDLPNDTYSINITFESQRSDISSTDLVQMKTVSNTTTYSKRN